MSVTKAILNTTTTIDIPYKYWGVIKTNNNY